MITRQDILNKYKVVDGKLYFKKWLRRKNRQAGTINADGYRIIGLNYKRYTEGYLMHIINHGKPPAGKLSNTADNIKPNISNYSGYKGVSKSRDRYVANISYQGKKIYLGSFDTAQQASHAYLVKRAELFEENS